MKSPIKNIVLRGDDPTGHGYYGAKRGKKKHHGLDLVATPGTEVLAPHAGIITKIGIVYRHTSLFRYIEVTGAIYRSRLMYGKPNQLVKVGHRVFEEDILGVVQNVAGYWNSKMINHLHWEIYKHGLLTDPEPLIICI